MKRLLTAEMVQISGPWVTNGTPARKALLALPECVGILPRVEEAHKQLHGAQPGQGDARGAEISAEAAEVDARHDAVVRGVDFVLQGIALLVGDSARAREIEAARALLTPEGVSIISTSYRNEAGAAALLKSRLGGAADVKSLLASVVVDKKKTLTSFVNERIAHGERLGVLEDERAQLRLTATESSAVANVNARNAWIRAVNALIANAELAGISPAQDTMIFGALREAETKANRRGKAPAVEPTPGAADPNAASPSPVPS
ncbi:hypothetical protein AKJ09_05395 [Labilithrix luteola]|uniref:Uncharacterized protein n=1 Tax=Labilithrix luteola TaxID=1391654 RepID=A0A0K1PZD0_9BACT|nr:hypothetical protein AKJ09_05395 [Labilithrix luteola]